MFVMSHGGFHLGVGRIFIPVLVSLVWFLPACEVDGAGGPLFRPLNFQLSKQPSERIIEPVVQQPFVPIGIRYYVEPMRREETVVLEERVAEDFERFRKWGLNCVVLQQVEDERIELFARQAAAHALRIIPESRLLYHYICFGEQPTDVESLDALVRRYMTRVGQRPVVAMHYLPTELTDEGEARARAVEALLTALDPDRPVMRLHTVRLADLDVTWMAFGPRGDLIGDDPSRTTREHAVRYQADLWLRRYLDLLAGQLEAVPVTSRILLLPTNGPWHVSEITPEWWAHLYHLCVGYGWTDGMIIDRYRTLATGAGGLLDGRRTVSPRQAAVLKRLTREIQKWGPMLRGTQVVARTPATAPSSIYSVYFSNGRRRLVLIYNRSHEVFAKEEVAILPDLDAGPVSRAIDLRNGDRHFREGQGLRILLRLKPAQARLYELF